MQALVPVSFPYGKTTEPLVNIWHISSCFGSLHVHHLNQMDRHKQKSKAIFSEFPSGKYMRLIIDYLLA